MKFCPICNKELHSFNTRTLGSAADLTICRECYEQLVTITDKFARWLIDDRILFARIKYPLTEDGWRKYMQDTQSDMSDNLLSEP